MKKLCRLSTMMCLFLLVGCTQSSQIKNPGGSEPASSFEQDGKIAGEYSALGNGWNANLRVDPDAQIGKDFWVTFELTGAADTIISTNITYTIPSNVLLKQEQVQRTNLTFQQSDSFSETLWMRIDKLDEPIIIRMKAEGIFDRDKTIADVGVAVYLVPVDGKIVAKKDIVNENSYPMPITEPLQELTPEPTPKVLRP